MRKILQHIAGMDLSVPSQGLGGWTDFRMVERGFGYVKKVKELAATDDLLVGVVDGTTRYFTNVRIADGLMICRRRQMPVVSRWRVQRPRCVNR